MVSIVTQSSCCSSAVVRDQKVIAQFLCSVLSLCFVLSKWVFTQSNDIYVILWAWGNQWGKHQVTITFDTKNAAAFTPHGYICLKWALFMLGDTTTTTTLDLLLLLLLHMSSHWTTTALHDLCDKIPFIFLIWSCNISFFCISEIFIRVKNLNIAAEFDLIKIEILDKWRYQVCLLSQ